MKIGVKFLMVLFIMTLFTYCDSDWNEDDELTMDRMPFDGNELRLDGYYYENRDIIDGKQWIHINFFYGNGIMLNGFAMKIEDIGIKEEEFRNGKFHEFVKMHKAEWSVFQIDGDNITYEVFATSSTGALRAYMYTGKILNDTTFHIIQSERSGSNKYSEEDFICRFKKFDGKPDSTNRFIK